MYLYWILLLSLLFCASGYCKSKTILQKIQCFQLALSNDQRKKLQLLHFKIYSREETGEDSYLMEVGGSSDVGFYGYLEGFNELIQQVWSPQFIINRNILFYLLSCWKDTCMQNLVYFNISKIHIHTLGLRTQTMLSRQPPGYPDNLTKFPVKFQLLFYNLKHALDKFK